MLRHMLFQRRGKSRMHAVLLGLYLGFSLFVLPLNAAQLWEEGSGAATGEQPVPPAFVELAKHLKPAVVNISSKQTEGKPAPSRAPFGREENDPFQDFFDRFFGGRGGPRRQRSGLGSGFIINSTGFIVTNNHVVEGATEIKVTLATKEEFDATLHEPMDRLGAVPHQRLGEIGIDIVLRDASEIVERRNYHGFGAANAAIRLAAQTRESRLLTMPKA